MPNPIEAILDREAGRTEPSGYPGPVSAMLANYDLNSSERLLGFLLSMGYDEMTIVTCDAWKRNCGGLPKNSFILAKLNADAAGIPAGVGRQFLILARIAETAQTPVASDIQSTIFQIHKVQAKIDPLTNAELQWGALKADILGTYYDEGENVAFGNDVDNFLSPHFYEIYVPTSEHLEALINSFVDLASPIRIGRLRYTETETLARGREVQVRISPGDFVANRTALFGKTRMGKSNTIKVILDTMLNSRRDIGQVVFDLSGEYTYPDPQTNASIYLRYQTRCSRYSLNPRRPQQEVEAGVAPPSVLRANFYDQIALGHSIITSLFDSYETSRPGYMAPFFAWEPADERDIAARFPDRGEQVRYRRALSMYKALLQRAGFDTTSSIQVALEIQQSIRRQLALDPDIANFASTERSTDGSIQIRDRQELRIAARIYQKLWDLYDSNRNNVQLFPTSRTSGKPYFEPIHECFLEMLGNRNILGPRKITRFRAYHDENGSDVITAIVNEVENCRTVLIDLANAEPVVAKYYCDMVTRAVLGRQMQKFSEQDSEQFAAQSVLFYFEEAHNLFRADDKDLTSVYNKLAKEGAKFRIGMVYATQSMTTLSPDLLKNTENFFIAHLNDDREVREIERRYEFKGIGLDIQRARAKGYVRLITLSHRYALPVQVKLFEMLSTETATSDGGR